MKSIAIPYLTYHIIECLLSKEDKANMTTKDIALKLHCSEQRVKNVELCASSESMEFLEAYSNAINADFQDILQEAEKLYQSRKILLDGLAKWFKDKRMAAGLSAKDVANGTDYTESYVHDIEEGIAGPDLYYIWTFCKVLKLRLTDFSEECSRLEALLDKSKK